MLCSNQLSLLYFELCCHVWNEKVIVLHVNTFIAIYVLQILRLLCYDSLERMESLKHFKQY